METYQDQNLQGQNLQGRALVASPYLSDPNFLRSVIYILRHDVEGAVGLVLNRPLQKTVGSLLGFEADEPAHASAAIYRGGPVEGPLIMLQEVGGEDENPRLVTGEKRILTIAESTDSATYRVFESYSGWDAGQLDFEMASGGWLVWDIEPSAIFADAEQLWQQALRILGREILAHGIDPSLIPDDPACN